MSRVPTPGKAKGLRTGDPVRRPYRRRARKAAGPPRATRDAVGHSGHRGQHPRCPPATRKNGEWIYGKSKSDASADRIVPLAPWLTDELRDYYGSPVCRQAPGRTAVPGPTQPPCIRLG